MRQYKNHSSRRINRIASALNAKRYLEIGIENGTTFFDIDIESKIGVDPNLLFDPASTQSSDTHLFKIPSDDFFIQYASSNPFDIVFIDGLHTFEQALRDLLNSLACSHGRSVIILDDVWPSDVYSALRNPVDALAFRHKAGGSDLAWHGDVYKVLFFISEMMPRLSYRTIAEHGNHQAIIYQKPKTEFHPSLGSIEEICELSYFDIQTRSDAMKFGSEDEIISELLFHLN